MGFWNRSTEEDKKDDDAKKKGLPDEGKWDAFTASVEWQSYIEELRKLTGNFARKLDHIDFEKMAVAFAGLAGNEKEAVSAHLRRGGLEKLEKCLREYDWNAYSRGD